MDLDKLRPHALHSPTQWSLEKRAVSYNMDYRLDSFFLLNNGHHIKKRILN